MQLKVNYPPDSIFQGFYEQREGLKKASLKNPPSKDKKISAPVLGAAFLGAVLPVLAINLAKGKGDKFISAMKNSSVKDKIKAGLDLFEIAGLKEIAASSSGAILGGLATGVASSKDSGEKKAKCKEGLFEFLNCMVPTCFLAAGEAITEKTGKFRSAPARIGMIAASVAGGMFVANKSSNKISQVVFDKNEEIKHERKFKFSDCLVHLDDVIDLLIIAKVPFAKCIHLDKILPLLYARSGHEAGTAKKEDV